MHRRKKNPEEIAAEIARNREHNTQQPINTLPKDILVYLGKKLDPVSFFALSRTSERHHALLDKSAEAKQTYDAVLDKLRRLLSHTTLGEYEQAELIWRENPILLTLRGTVFHPNRLYFDNEEIPYSVPIPDDISLSRYKFVNLTAWQIALINEEYEEAEKMGQFMSEEEKRKQFLEIFPKGKMQYSQDLAGAKELLQNVYNAVIEDEFINEDDLTSMSEPTRDALEALRDYIKPKPEHQTGLLVDPEIYLAAFLLYDYDNEFNWSLNWHQRSFWCVRIEEMIASVLGTGYLRPHAQGIGQGAFHRRGCLLSDGSSYFSFRRDLTSIAGSHFFVGYYSLASEAEEDDLWEGPLGGRGGPERISKLIKSSMSSKNERKVELMRQYSPALAARCVIC